MSDQPDSSARENDAKPERSRTRSTRWNGTSSDNGARSARAPRGERSDDRGGRSYGADSSHGDRGGRSVGRGNGAYDRGGRDFQTSRDDNRDRGFRVRDDRRGGGSGAREEGGPRFADRGGYSRDDRRGGGDGGRNYPERGDRRDSRGTWGRDDRREGPSRGGRPERPGDGTAQRGPRSWDAKGDDRVKRAPEPELPGSITGQELDKDVRQQLRTLSKDNADGVAKHLVAAAEFLDEDPDRALLHAQHAVSRAARVPAAREALGLVLYRNGDFSEALREFRTARRLSGSDHLLPYMVDCERGLGRYERALELANSPEAQRLNEADNIELAIVVSGVRRDMGQARAAVVGLRIPALRRATTQPWAARLFYAYADALLDIGEFAEAREWFVKADKIDRDGETDAADRIDEIDGFDMTDLAPDEEEVVDPRFADLDLSKPFGAAPEGAKASQEPGNPAS